ncbi:hypothetical protein [Xenorhabdus griffiniae]|uniref:DUF5675 domain-containing protein n=1 Tax=Xenorhabdus griffiniae TaxID=351672 RepID=A0ABY9XD39_9GAMM|nr:hypothetical protein [Xenorhabdus griffiniae]WMV70831.1 hypothetical protein QL128_11385 [Xenorhabdus griffiniae]WNH00507.1 hypothetical protein QL112_011390 [Xenorhabdus griffiniae]
MDTQKKIFCVSLLGREQVQATAVFDNGLLVIVKLEKITGPFGTWKPKLKKELQKKHEDGFHLLVEERGDDFSEYAHKILLEDSDSAERRGYLHIAFDHYFNLIRIGGTSDNRQQGCLVLNAGLERHWIREQMVNVIPDNRGRYCYDIDHSKFCKRRWILTLMLLIACYSKRISMP